MKHKKIKVIIIKKKKTQFSVKDSVDYKDNPDGALKALDKTNVALFLISKNWVDDKRAQSEWQHAVDLGKPMIYMIDKTKEFTLDQSKYLLIPNLVGTVNHYGDNAATFNIIANLILETQRIQGMQ